MQCQTGSARMIAAGGIDDENIWSLTETPDRFLQQQPFTKRQQARDIRMPCLSANDRDRRSPVGPQQRGRGPTRITGGAWTGNSPGEANEAARCGPSRVRRLPELGSC